MGQLHIFCERSIIKMSNLHVKTGDSSSWTSLSICISMFTDISNSALHSRFSTEYQSQLGLVPEYELTIFEEDDKPARKPGLVSTVKMWPLNYDTMTGTKP